MISVFFLQIDSVAEEVERHKSTSDMVTLTHFKMDLLMAVFDDEMVVQIIYHLT